MIICNTKIQTALFFEKQNILMLKTSSLIYQHDTIPVSNDFMLTEFTGPWAVAETTSQVAGLPRKFRVPEAWE